MEVGIDEAGNHHPAASVKDDVGLFHLQAYARDPAIPDANGALNQIW
jgi:hypothetical protein